jgi:MYXO-CTERM domain-containing protein
VVPTDEIDGDGDWWTPCHGDCNDADPDIKPAQAEVWCNGIDDNCDGYTDPLCEEPVEEDCGCSQRPGPAGWPWTLLGALGLILFRRRAGPGGARGRTG